MLTRVRKWWKNGAARPLVPFEVACVCGQLARGQRAPRHQVVRCSSCGQPVFVLPYSPLSPLAAARQGTAAPAVAESAPFSWRTPVLAGLVTLAVVVGLFTYFLPRLLTPTGPAVPTEDTAAQIRTHIRAGMEELGAGNFQVARQKFEAGQALRQQHPGALSPRESRELNHLDRQAGLLADGSADSLQEILRQAVVQEAREWQILFGKRYHGKAIVFDGWVRRDVAGQVQLLDYHVFVNNEAVRLEWKELQLLHYLPLHEPQRLLFGARLASARREDRAEWVIRFLPESGVLITDPGAAAAACLGRWDASLEEVLQRQSMWVTELP